jgi:hypothetical protein
MDNNAQGCWNVIVSRVLQETELENKNLKDHELIEYV